MMQFDLDINSKTTPLEKYWELCIGSCHATTALRGDYRAQLIRCQRELGFRYLRFHGIFDDDMSVIKQKQFTCEVVLSFTNVDSIFDFLLSINMKPFIEFSFMPECLKSNDSTFFHYKGNTSPPASQEKWGWLVEQFITHLITRYGRDEVRQWFFEVWNEPNLGGSGIPVGFWSGTQKDYFELYKTTALAVKSVDSMLRMGGPATSNNAWLPEFIAFCRDNAIPLDFITTHHYPTDVLLGYGVEDSKNAFLPPVDVNDPYALMEFMKRPDAVQKMIEFRANQWRDVDRGVLTGMMQKAVVQAQGLPLYYTEWNSLAGIPSDGPFGASFIAKTVLDGVGLVQGYSYWTFSDIFEEEGMPSTEFHGGYGLLTLHGIPKAPYHAFRMLHLLGESLYESGLHKGTVDVYAIRKSASNAVQILLVNHNSLLHDIDEERVSIRLHGLGGCSVAATELMRVDDEHSNAVQKWRELGKPEYVTEAEMHTLMAASSMERTSVSGQSDAEGISYDIALPPMGMVLLTVYLDKH
jgi:xylan 1,4-beta-xylosidase